MKSYGSPTARANASFDSLFIILHSAFLMDLSKVISAGVGPIIVISACGLLCSTFYNRMTNVITRLRAFQRERLAEQALLDRETDDVMRSKRQELLAILSQQTDTLVRRVHYVRRT